MRTVNLDTLVRIGQRPWRPVPEAEDIDVWDKYDFPNCGTYRLGDDLIVFTLITTAGIRSLWAYVPVPSGEREAVAEAHFDTENEFDAFLDSRFAEREAVFAAAENFVITAKSDGILIPSARHALLAAGARWYAERTVALSGVKARLPAADDADADTLLRAAQGALARG
jgi:hypothetical protein